MNDWDALFKNAATGNGFVGRTQSDEDAYFAAFADDPAPVWPVGINVSFSDLLDVVRRRLVS